MSHGADYCFTCNKDKFLSADVGGCDCCEFPKAKKIINGVWFEQSAYDALNNELNSLRAEVSSFRKCLGSAGYSILEEYTKLKEENQVLKIQKEGYETGYDAYKARTFRLEEELATSKDEYDNLCKFTTQFEEERDKYKQALESIIADFPDTRAGLTAKDALEIKDKSGAV